MCSSHCDTIAVCVGFALFVFLEEKLFIMASVPLNVRRLSEWMSVCWVIGGETGNHCLYIHIKMSIK